MRFAYIDSQGKEVAIPSVDALRLRIALKAIVEDTVFFDSTSARWAPAEEHEIFRTLKKELGEQEEGTFVAPQPELETSGEEPTPGDLAAENELEVEELDPALAGDPDEDSEDDWRFDISNAPAGQGGEKAAPVEPLGTSSWLDLDETDEPNGDFDLDSVPRDDAPDHEDAGGALDLVPELGGPTPAPAEPEPEPAEAAPEVGVEAEDETAGFDLTGELEVDEGEPASESAVDAPGLGAGPTPDVGGDEGLPDFVEPTHVGGSDFDGLADEPAPLEGLSQDRFEADDALEAAGWGDEPPPPPAADELEVEGLPEIVAEPAAAAPPPRRGANDLPVPSREELAARRQAERPGGGGARPNPGPPPRRRTPARSGGALVGIVGALALAGGAGWFLLGRGSGDAEVEPDPLPAANVQIPDLPVALEPAMRAVADEARAATLDALRTHHLGAGVPAEPDREWLAGAYLANASSYPGVDTYWSAMDSYLRSMQAAEDSLFMALLAREVQASDLSGDERDLVEARVAAGFRATSRDRGIVFQRARAVGEAALRLHAFLLENEDRIAYEPGVGGLSADPVLEAIPETPEIGEAMWARVGDITEAMDALDFLDRVTTERLIDAIVQRLAEIPLR